MPLAEYLSAARLGKGHGAICQLRGGYFLWKLGTAGLIGELAAQLLWLIRRETAALTANAGDVRADDVAVEDVVFPSSFSIDLQGDSSAIFVDRGEQASAALRATSY